MEIINLQMQEDGMWKGKVKLDGKICNFTCTTEFVHDRISYLASINTIRTSPFTDEEVMYWKKYDEMLGDPEFWENARSRVKIIPDEYSFFTSDLL